MFRLLLDDFRGGFEKGPWWQPLFDRYSITTWMVVLNLGSTGLLVSWLMKYADNIVKVYSTSMALSPTMVLSVYLFNLKPTLQSLNIIKWKMGGTTTGAAAFAMPAAELRPNGHHHQQVEKRDSCYNFQMPLHYPRYKKCDYETMPEWKLDCLLKEYGLPVTGDVYQKRDFAMGAFLWPNSENE